MRKRRALLGAGIGVAGLSLAGAAVLVYNAQRADLAWRPHVVSPTFTTGGPRVVIDEGHFNGSTAGWEGRYLPFARLLRADGYEVRRSKEPFTAGALAGVRVLVIANAAGAPKPQVLGINLPVRTEKRRDDPAFTPAEIQAVVSWVSSGGSLLLVADHTPFGAAAAALAAAFNVTMHQGFLEIPNEVSDPLLFSRENGRLGDHAILAGAGPTMRINRVETFTGQSLSGPPTASILLRLPIGAVEFFPTEGGESPSKPAGNAQALAFAWGQGRVVILGEAAMLTAQVARGESFGMNPLSNDNEPFARNTLKWLARVPPLN